MKQKEKKKERRRKHSKKEKKQVGESPRMIRDLDLIQRARRLKVVFDGLPLFGGAQWQWMPLLSATSASVCAARVVSWCPNDILCKDCALNAGLTPAS